MKSQILLTVTFYFLIISTAHAQLRKDLETKLIKTGSIIKYENSLTELQLYPDINKVTLSSIQITSSQSNRSTNQILFSERFSSEWVAPPIFKYINSGQYNSYTALNPDDSFAQVVGKIGLLYGWNKIFNN